MELFTGLLPPGETHLNAEVVFRRLGHLSFDANTASGHQARELKSVHVNCDAQWIRIVLHACHANSLNVHSQAGFMALTIVGESLPPPPLPIVGSTSTRPRSSIGIGGGFTTDGGGAPRGGGGGGIL